MNNKEYEDLVLELKKDINNLEILIIRKQEKVKKKNKEIKSIYSSLDRNNFYVKKSQIDLILKKVLLYEKDIVILEKKIISKKEEINELLEVKNSNFENVQDKKNEKKLFQGFDLEIENNSKLPKKVVVLFIASNPASSSPLKLDDEIRGISKKIRESEYRKSIEVKSIWATRPHDLLQAINEFKPTIIHFSGHGTPNDELVLQDRDGNSQLVTLSTIIEVFKSISTGIELAVFNTCFSKVQAEEITKNIPCAIGMNTSVSDYCAMTFSSQLYSAIGFGHSIQQSFLQAKVAIMLENLEEENTPQLFVKEGIDVDNTYLVKVDTSEEELFTFKVGEEKVKFEEKLISLEKDIVKIYAHSHDVGVRAEYAWIKNKYPESNTIMQSLTDLEHLTDNKSLKKNIHFDIVKIELKNGRKKEIHFDISEFVQVGMVTSITDSTSHFKNKIEEIYSDYM